jgi:hypothetical protein
MVDDGRSKVLTVWTNPTNQMAYSKNYEAELNKWQSIVEEKRDEFAKAFFAYNEAIKKQIAGAENFDERIKLSDEVKKSENNLSSAKRRMTSELSKLTW